LIRRGVAQDRLVLVEYNPDFCKLLKRRFPQATIIQGDAYDIRETLDGAVTEPGAAVISSLPLFTKPIETRIALLDAVHEVTRANAPFVQFTYAVVPPIPKNPKHYTVTGSNRVWLNFPPARVWVYRRRGAAQHHASP
jgi:phosphatidylethanolamine/phosphatidyl-N-methylethanolamine N-methyltransferase